MVKFNGASNVLLKLKKDLSTCDKDSIETMFSRCSDYIRSVILDGLNSYDEFYHSYCSYAVALGIEYRWGSNMDIMCVSIRNNRACMYINPLAVVSVVNSDSEILFMVAHEVKHMLYKHIVKYHTHFSDDVTRLFMNLATDVEINESLKTELTGFYTRVSSSCRLRDAIPEYVFDLKAVSGMLFIDYEKMKNTYAKNRASKDKAFSEYLYGCFNDKCKELLGYSINEILYRVKIHRTTFSEEVFRVVDGIESRVFSISSMEKARKFCTYIAVYLKRSTGSMLAIPMDSGGKSSDDGYEDTLVYDRLEGSSKDYRSARRSYTSDGSKSSDLNDVLEEVNNTQKVYTENLGIKTRGYGNDSGLCDVDVKECETRVPWQSVLFRRMVTMSDKYEYTKNRINRRQPYRLDISGVRKKPEFNLVISIDESGSISNDEYSYFISELVNVVKNFNCNIHLYEHTDKVESYSYFDSRKAKSELVIDSSVFSKRFVGGTSLQPVFTAINTNRKIDKRDSIVIMLTDGQGEERINFGRCKNRLWVLTGDNPSLSCKEDDKNIFPVYDIRKVS